MVGGGGAADLVEAAVSDPDRVGVIDAHTVGGDETVLQAKAVHDLGCGRGGVSKRGVAV